jgi:hypothetical protein
MIISIYSTVFLDSASLGSGEYVRGVAWGIRKACVVLHSGVNVKSLKGF